MNHYVVLEKLRQKSALIHDPAGTSGWMDLAELGQHFTGVALELRPSTEFRQAKPKPKLRISQLWQRIIGVRRAAVQTLILTLALQLFILASPLYMQVAVDSALSAKDATLLTALALGFGLFTLFNVGATALRSFVLLAAGNSLAFGITSNIARKMMQLPIRWFENRAIGDILSRFQSVRPVQQFLSETAVSVLLDSNLAILLLVMMFLYSVPLTLVALTSTALYSALRAILYSPLRRAQERAIVAGGKEQSVVIESIRGITTLRLFQRETTRHAFWQRRLADSINANIDVSRISILQNSANALIFGIEGVFSIYLAIRSAMSGVFTVGMIYAYLSYKSQFVQKTASIIDQAINLKMLGLHLERLSDITLEESDVSVVEPDQPWAELKGKLELRNVSYSYGEGEPLVLNNVNMIIQPGDHVAITSPSGCGKTTLAKVALGLVEPTMGEVLIDDIPLKKFGYKNMREQIAVVMQNDNLFSGSLSDNIALFDDQPDHDLVVKSAADAALHEDIEKMPMGYHTLVGDMGSTLSGGQKQRLLLARALYKQPRLLLLDEGTSHLDSARERDVNRAVSALGITRIIIAHRAETVNSASRVLLMKNGKIQDVSHISTRETPENVGA